VSSHANHIDGVPRRERERRIPRIAAAYHSGAHP